MTVRGLAGERRDLLGGSEARPFEDVRVPVVDRAVGVADLAHPNLLVHPGVPHQRVAIHGQDGARQLLRRSRGSRWGTSRSAEAQRPPMRLPALTFYLSK
jgi:hypothetical protein